MINLLNWPSLDSRRTYFKLIMFYKIINYLIIVPSISLTPMFTSSRGHSQHFITPYVRINAYLFSFLPSTFKLWNNLPENKVNQPPLNDFKELLYS